jgi:chromosome segregation ATPase
VAALQVRCRDAKARRLEQGALRERRFVKCRRELQQFADKILFSAGGGNLKLSTDASHESSLSAFQSGTRILVRPPSKEFQEVNVLSGGEQALATMAMCIASIAASRVMAKDKVGTGAMVDHDDEEEEEEEEARGRAQGVTEARGAGGSILVDEIDAAMDHGNVRRVGAILRRRATEGNQCICVSLNEELYVQADALFGVYRDGNEGSKVLSVDLSEYRE